MSDCVSPGQINDFLTKNANLVEGSIIRSLAINSPWVNLFPTRTWASGVSDTRRAVRQGAVAPTDLSQAAPQWGLMDCRVPPTPIVTGSTELQYEANMYNGRGPEICLTKAYNAVESSIINAEKAIKDHVQTLWNAWLRYRAFFDSATKVVAKSGTAFQNLVASGYQTNFVPGLIPDSPVNASFIRQITNFLVHQMLCGDEYQFGNGGRKHFRFLSDKATIDNVRNQTEVQLNLRALAAGQDRRGIDSMIEYEWDILYQGVAFGVDESILRADGINADGTINFVEPFIAVPSTKEVIRQFNPAWAAAPYQVSFLCGDDSFVREIPEEYLGEGMTRFDKQFWGGMVRWHNQIDNDCNEWGDTGFHKYKLAAAFRPEHPEFMVAILHVRCVEDTGLVPCTPQGYYSNSL